MSSETLTAGWAPDRCWRRLERLDVAGGLFATVSFGEPLADAELSQASSFVLPGLIDAHVHLSGDTARVAIGRPARAADPTDGVRWRTIRANLRRALGAGITTLRDVGSLGPNWAKVRDGIDDLRHETPLPRVFTAGQLLTTHDGHGADYGRALQAPEDLAPAVRDLAERGADFIKIINDPMRFSLRQLSDAVSVASQYGLPVSVHAYTDEAARLATAAGARNLEHPGEYTDEAIQGLVERDMEVTTTFVAGFDTVADPIGTAAEDLFEEADLELFSNWHSASCRSCPHLAAHGVRLVLGTDAGFPGTPMDSLHREIAGLALLGLPRATVLAGATEHVAHLLGRGGELGVLAPGAAADWLVVDRDPWLDPRVLRRPGQVWLAGRLVSTNGEIVE